MNQAVTTIGFDAGQLSKIEGTYSRCGLPMCAVTCWSITGHDETATSSAQDTILVEIVTDEGVTGFGETDLNPWIAQACIDAPSMHSMARGLREMLIGEDPLDVAGLWQKLYVGSAMTGRRGAMINAIGALDIALHDLRGSILDQPVWRGMSESKVRSDVAAYASLQPDVADVQSYAELLIEETLAARDLGFRAAKASLTLSGPYAHKGMNASWSEATAILASLRAAVGDDFGLMVDVQYAFQSAEQALPVLREWRDFNLVFVETPLWIDDLDGYRRLSDEQSIPIAMGEWLTTRYEFDALIRQGNVGVVQPDIGRVGGLTEALRVAELARKHGRRLVPHLWKTGLSIAAALHFAAVTAECEYIEFLPATASNTSGLRRDLTPDFELVDGKIAVPDGPGLGVTINHDAVERYAHAATDFWQSRPVAGRLNDPSPARPS